MQLKTLYDYWFTQFDFPNDYGRPYKLLGGQMVWCEQLKRNIPKNWYTKSIIDLAQIYQPKTISNDLFNDTYPHYVYGGGGLIGKYNEYNHINEEVIISCRGNCGNIFFTMPYSWITGNAMVVSPLNKDISKYYLYQYLKSYGVNKYISGSVQKQLTRENLSVMPIIVPPKSLLDKFDVLAKDIHLQQQQITEQNTYLANLRDWLLPMLMNGQVTIED